MRLPKLIASLSIIAACAFGVCNANAQEVTNNVTLTVMEIQEGSVTPITKGTNTVMKVAIAHEVINTAGFIAELGHATTNSFSKAAKLQLIEGPNTQFAVSDGTNFVLIDTNIMSVSQPSGNSIFSGTMAGFLIPAPSIKILSVFELDFNDVNVGSGGQDLQFSLRGLGSLTLSDAKGGATQILSGKFGFSGDGSSGNGSTNFVATGEMSASGKGVLFN